MEERTLNNTTENQAKNQVSDLQLWGESDMWVLLSKASSKAQGWMKSTKAMQTPQGCLVQVTTREELRDENNKVIDVAIAEAVSFVPAVTIGERRDEEGNVIARKLIHTPLSQLVEDVTQAQYINVANQMQAANVHAQAESQGQRMSQVTSDIEEQEVDYNDIEYGKAIPADEETQQAVMEIVKDDMDGR